MKQYTQQPNYVVFGGTFHELNAVSCNSKSQHINAILRCNSTTRFLAFTFFMAAVFCMTQSAVSSAYNIHVIKMLLWLVYHFWQFNSCASNRCIVSFVSFITFQLENRKATFSAIYSIWSEKRAFPVSLQCRVQTHCIHYDYATSKTQMSQSLYKWTLSSLI